MQLSNESYTIDPETGEPIPPKGPRVTPDIPDAPEPEPYPNLDDVV